MHREFHADMLLQLTDVHMSPLLETETFANKNWQLPNRQTAPLFMLVENWDWCAHLIATRQKIWRLVEGLQRWARVASGGEQTLLPIAADVNSSEILLGRYVLHLSVFRHCRLRVWNPALRSAA